MTGRLLPPACEFPNVPPEDRGYHLDGCVVCRDEARDLPEGSPIRRLFDDRDRYRGR